MRRLAEIRPPRNDEAIRLTDLKRGDLICGFADFGCIPDRAVREVQIDSTGPFVACRSGKHYLDGQEGDDGVLVGLRRYLKS